MISIRGNRCIALDPLIKFLYYHFGEMKLYFTLSALSHREGQNLSLMTLN